MEEEQENSAPQQPETSVKKKKAHVGHIRLHKAKRIMLKSDKSERSYLSQSHILATGYKRKIKVLLANNKSLAKALEVSQLHVASMEKQLAVVQKQLNFQQMVRQKLKETSSYFSKATTSLVEALNFCGDKEYNELTLTLTGQVVVPESDLPLKRRSFSEGDNCQSLNFMKPPYMAAKMSKETDMSLIAEVSVLDETKLPPLMFTEENEETETEKRTTSTRSRRAVGSRKSSLEPRVTGRELRSHSRSKSTCSSRRNSERNAASPETPKTPPRCITLKSHIPVLNFQIEDSESTDLLPETADAGCETTVAANIKDSTVVEEIQESLVAESVTKRSLPIPAKCGPLPKKTKIPISSHVKSKTAKTTCSKDNKAISDSSKAKGVAEVSVQSSRRETFVIPREQSLSPTSAAGMTKGELKRQTYFVKNAENGALNTLKRQTYCVPNAENDASSPLRQQTLISTVESSLAKQKASASADVENVENPNNNLINGNIECASEIMTGKSTTSTEAGLISQGKEAVTVDTAGQISGEIANPQTAMEEVMANMTNYAIIDMSLTGIVPSAGIIEVSKSQKQTIDFAFSESDPQPPSMASSPAPPVSQAAKENSADMPSQTAEENRERKNGENLKEHRKVRPSRLTSQKKQINYKDSTATSVFDSDSDSDFKPDVSPMKKKKTDKKPKRSVKKSMTKRDVPPTPNSVTRRKTFLTLNSTEKPVIGTRDKERDRYSIFNVFEFPSDNSEESSDDDGFLGKNLKIKPLSEFILKEKNGNDDRMTSKKSITKRTPMKPLSRSSKDVGVANEMMRTDEIRPKNKNTDNGGEKDNVKETDSVSPETNCENATCAEGFKGFLEKESDIQDKNSSDAVVSTSQSTLKASNIRLTSESNTNLKGPSISGIENGQKVSKSSKSKANVQPPSIGNQHEQLKENAEFGKSSVTKTNSRQDNVDPHLGVGQGSDKTVSADVHAKKTEQKKAGKRGRPLRSPNSADIHAKKTEQKKAGKRGRPPHSPKGKTLKKKSTSDVRQSVDASVASNQAYKCKDDEKPQSSSRSASLPEHATQSSSASHERASTDRLVSGRRQRPAVSYKEPNQLKKMRRD